MPEKQAIWTAFSYPLLTLDYVKIGVQNWCDRQTVRQTPHLVSDLAGTLVLSIMKVQPETKKLSPENPLSNLLIQLDTQISQTPADIRNLTFTDGEQLIQFFQCITEAANSFTEGVAHKALTITSQPASIGLFVSSNSHMKNAFVVERANLKVEEEFKRSYSNQIFL